MHGRTKSEHDKRLQNVLGKLKEENLTLNLEKCEFAMLRITFMGHVLPKKGSEPTQDRVRCMKEARKRGLWPRLKWWHHYGAAQNKRSHPSSKALYILSNRVKGQRVMSDCDVV